MLTMQLPVLCRLASLSLLPKPIAYPKQCLLQNHSMDSLSTWQSRNYSECDLSSVTPTRLPPFPGPRAVRSIPGASPPCHGVLLRISCGMVSEVFLARGGNFRCWPKADTPSAIGRSQERRSARVTIMTWQKPETALEKSLTPRVLKELIKFAISHLYNPSIYNY